MGNESIKEALNAYGVAMRGDYGGINGDVVWDDLLYIASCIDTNTPLEEMLQNLEITKDYCWEDNKF